MLQGNNFQALKGVSVPIRGLFNLTFKRLALAIKDAQQHFPSPSGDYLI